VFSKAFRPNAGVLQFLWTAMLHTWFLIAMVWD